MAFFSRFCVVVVPVVLWNAGTALAQTSSAKPPAAVPPGKKDSVFMGKMQVAPPPGLALFQKALEATNDGKLAEAERLYRKLLKQEPTAAAAWANLGLLVGRQGRVSEAIDSLKKATTLAPEAGPFWAQLSAYQLQAKQWKPAETSARKAIARDPRNWLALANLGDTLMMQKRFREAVPVFKQLQAMEGKAPKDHTEVSLILSYSGAGNHREALILAKQRAQRRSQDPKAYLLLGDTARRAGDLVAAKPAYTRAAELDPQNAGAKAALSFLAAMEGDSKTSLRLIQEQLTKRPEDARLYFQQGSLFYNDEKQEPVKRFAKAAEAFRKAVLYAPKEPLYLSFTGIALMRQASAIPGERPEKDRLYKDAGGYLRSALSVSPRYTTARLALANIAEQTAKFTEATAQYQAVLSYDSNNREARRGLAGIYYATGKKTEAFAEMEEIARRLPLDTEALAELASWQVAEKQSDKAKATYERVLKRDPQNEAAYIALARLYEEEKNWVAAKARYQAVLSAHPGNQDATLLLGELWLRDGNKEEALEVYRRFLSVNPSGNLVRWQRGLVLKELQRHDEAIAEFQQLTLKKDDPNRVVYLLSVPNLLLERNQPGQAVQELIRIRQENPKEEEVTYLLAKAYARNNQPEKARELLNELKTPSVAAQAPTPRPFLALASVYEEGLEWDKAALEYETALRLDPMQQTALSGLSRVREKQGKPDAAPAFLEQMVMESEKEPSLPAIGGLHQWYQQARNLDKYREFTRRLAEKYPENRVALYVRARSLTEENPKEAERQQAVEIYRQLVKKNDKDIEAWNQLGQELEALQQKEEAIAAYRALLKLVPGNTNAQAALRRLEAKTPAGK